MATLKDPVTGRHTMGLAAKNDFTVNSRFKTGGTAGTVVAPVLRNTTQTTIDAAPANTLLTAGQIYGGVIRTTGTPNPDANFTLTLPTAALLESLADTDIGDTFSFSVLHNGGGGNNRTCTLVVGANGTAVGSALPAQADDSTAVYTIRITAAGYDIWNN